MIKLCVSFPTSSRKDRGLKSLGPKEFLYGTNCLDTKYKVNYVNSRTEPTNFFYKSYLLIEKMINRLTHTGIFKTRVLLNQKQYNFSEIIISFTDAYSINIGLFFKKNKDQKLIGVFHGLTDFYDRVPFLFRPYFKKKLSKSLKNLNFCFFLGDKDLHFIQKEYPFIQNKSKIFKFGVDHLYWKPLLLKESIDIFCVGSDINRDYEILKSISPQIKINLLTNKKINLKKHKNIKLIKGGFNNSLVTDDQLRVLYNSAKIILIPLKDVYQPSGQSVALQAMSCGKTVVISNTMGLFDKVHLIDNHNIIFVKPESKESLNIKIEYLLKQNNKRKTIGKLARNTVIKNFTIKHMSDCLNEILEKIK